MYIFAQNKTFYVTFGNYNEEFNFDVIGTEKEENINLWQVYLTAYKLKTTVTNALF